MKFEQLFIKYSWLYAIFILDFNSCYSYEDITKQLDELEMCKSNEKVAYLRGHNEARNDHPLAALDSMHKYFDKQLELLFVSEKQVNQTKNDILSDYERFNTKKGTTSKWNTIYKAPMFLFWFFYYF